MAPMTVPATEGHRAFLTELREAAVDWQMTRYGGAVHSFTDWTAKGDLPARFTTRRLTGAPGKRRSSSLGRFSRQRPSLQSKTNDGYKQFTLYSRRSTWTA